MGRNQRRKGGGMKRERDGEWTADKRDEGTLSNAALEKYYRGKVVPEEQWETFITCMRSPLPLSLRVNTALEHAEEVAQFIGSVLSAVFTTTTLAFYPRGLGFQCDASRGDLKRNDAHKRTKRIISALNEGGYLTRQETVSMIPPLLLDVHPGHRVLDMCSAPGSKTSQILERLVENRLGGVVVANDLNSSRLDVLTHQTNRCPEAHGHIVITNADAMMYPLLSDAAWKFDRVLCDVMCSGDGTLRKSIDLWGRWNTLQGADLHSSQCRVLTRGMQLCKKGGLVVYSTCSLNPVEDEAVLSECIAKSNGTFRLVDPSVLLPELKRSEGLFAWTFTTKELDAELSSFDESTKYREARGGKGFYYRPSMFANDELLRQQNMQHAVRVLPHAQNTGGFFIAALECLEDYPNSVVSVAVPNEKPLKKISDAMRASLQKSLGLPDDFPYNNLYFRNEQAREQKIYFACDAVGELLPHLQANVAQVGAKIFDSYVKHSNDHMRFCAEGVSTLAPYLPESFFIRNVDPQVILDLGRAGMDQEVFCRRVQRDAATLPPHSFVLEAALPHGLHRLRVAAERFHTTITLRLLDWQATLCKLALGLPVVDEAAPAEQDQASDSDDEAQPVTE